jgi:transcription elongation GreA/GreB family factor
VDKRALIQELIAVARGEIAILERAARATREAATHEESRPENDKDTRAIEASYLAGAQADRVRDIERVINALEFLPLRPFTATDRIASAALVEVDVDGKRSHYFLAPQGGGLRVTIDGVVIQVITPPSSVGRALLGRAEGEVVEVRAEGGVREYEIVAVK